ncbi:3-hexulose-6-phosphate synthase [Lentibacillus sp. CBA3610]|uniref:3-hexulose-6-phosphate synthase n=1 Tax=Lentibacillus sp. CBA3610 TaxID=2518176 RepID=UPI001595A579|nr:3-hexulose-6-phosphate synthase [Lentibacillus sp. CBA3610]QKY70243.1 Fe-S cluster assembly protein HesB [Lentibacillus sp. CBA3610]
MKLQLALDRLTWDECMDVLNQTEKSIDIIEVGTGVIKEYGMAIVKEIRKRFPSHLIMADMKTCDAGGHEARQAFGAGADIVTVMAFSSALTIQDTVDVAREYDGRVMVDLLEVQHREKLNDLEKLSVELVSLHVGKDKQKKGAFNTEMFHLVEGFPFEVAVAGGIDETTAEQAASGHPAIIIVGSAITKADDSARAAENIRKIIKG